MMRVGAVRARVMAEGGRRAGEEPGLSTSHTDGPDCSAAHMRRAAPSTRRMRPLTRSLGAKCRRQRPVVVHAAEAEVATVEVDEWSARSEELSLLKVEGLKALLREYELKVSGQKAELVERLVTHERGLAAAAVAASVESVEAAAAVESVEIAAAVESIEAASAERANDSDAEVPPEATEGPQGEVRCAGEARRARASLSSRCRVC